MAQELEGSTDTISFIGTATTLIRLGSFTLLTDPNFLHRGQRAYLGKGLWSRRLTDPALSPDALPVLSLDSASAPTHHPARKRNHAFDSRARSSTG